MFVYRVGELRYLTVKEMFDCGEWQTYELNHEGEFATFNHEEMEPLIGRGYSVSLEVNNMMVEKINQLIHKNRLATFPIEGEVHLVCSESTAGAIRVGLDRPKTVIGFQVFFSIGPVWQLDQKQGQTNRFEWINENINLEQDHFDIENTFNKTLLEISEIPENKPIYIWTADNGEEQTGVRFILQLLKDKANEVILLNTTELFQKGNFLNEDEFQTLHHSSGVHPKNLKLLFQQNKTRAPLSNQERAQFQLEWESLAQTVDVLRIWQNGGIEGVPEDYYDQFIISTIERMHSEQQQKRDFILAAKVIGEIIGQTDGVVGDFYLEYRIRHLIYSGVLELKGVPRSMRHYRVKLR
ncbi:DUF1835 domain-containing protein [Neobacillus sp. OS1-2]|uniref:DUF1835 domain-containing protein n=1 Tax=Neobacillus sp. OS1-2 TaxID=3070680 RepID=UPI0027DECAD8|nr:DUF1835 domain-containing protein [Neobacillus sp. OS1-2]WML38200.1 DUF1835 domain-containing protein [Neobacillus sp. OS1-2]